MTSKQLVQLKKILATYTELELYDGSNVGKINELITDNCYCMHCSELKNGICTQDIPY